MDAPNIRAVIAEDDSLVADVIEEELRKLGVDVVGRATDGMRWRRPVSSHPMWC